MRVTPSRRLTDKHQPSKARQGLVQVAGRVVEKLCCCVRAPMRDPEQKQPIGLPEDATEFDSSGFIQLGPNDVSYKVRTQPKMVHQYIIGDVLGEGSYAKVREAVDSITNRKVAIKILTKRKLKKLPAGESAVKKEVEVLNKLRHVNIVEIIDYFTIEEKEKIYIVLEYVGGGTLQGLIERAKDGVMPRRQAQLIFRQLLAAVEYMHSRNIVHCDIKPDNMMFTADGILKLTDFGVAEEIGLESDYEILTKSGGSPAFQPPEVKSGGHASSPVKIDIWAIGITLYIIATGKYPFSGTNIYAICENISKGEYKLPETLEPELSKLIKGILQLNPIERYSLQDMKRNPWVVNDITNDEPLLPYTAAVPPDHPHHDIFAQNYRIAAGQQGLYSSAEDYEDEEPTMFTMEGSEQSEQSNYSSGIHGKLKHSNNSNSPNSSMTNLPTTTLTTPPFASPTKTRRTKKSRCLVM
eukprot:Phypoly_transcript_05051.p1 GENE.Phypoly_transcript_05051~~Phypoly_transcript_05051.p1  ORF type:complete len:467 (+),score=67.39 Phypoly_transcript_05051:237-1637(+)